MTHSAWLRHGVSAALVCSAFLTTTAARADDDSGEKFWSVGVGAFGLIGGNFLDKPANNDYKLSDGAILSNPTYPGFGKLMGGGGGFIEGRFFKFVGLEIDVIYSKDSGKADIDYSVNGVKQGTWTVEISSNAIHMPVLLKGVLPTALVSPYVLIGPEFVFPSSPSASAAVKSGAGAYPYGPLSASADGYTMLCAGFGFEVKLPVPSVDIRIPFSLRGSFNLGTPDNVNELVTYDITRQGNGVRVPYNNSTYKAEWQYRAYATLGAAMYF